MGEQLRWPRRGEGERGVLAEACIFVAHCAIVVPQRIHLLLQVPYSNAGQGVFTITNEEELAEFMDTEFFYDKFILQGLIGNSKWSSTTKVKFLRRKFQ